MRCLGGGAVVAGFGVAAYAFATCCELKRGGEANDSAANDRDGHGYALCGWGLSTKARTAAILATRGADGGQF